MRSDRPALRCSAVVVCLLFTFTSAALAEFSEIRPPHPGEDSHQMIFGSVYGGTFVPTGPGSVDFTNGSILAKRVDDFFFTEDGGGPLDMGPTGGDDDTDQTWRAEFTNAVAEAKFAEFDQQFGFFPGSSGGSYIPLFNVTGDGYGVTGEANLTLLPGTTIRWGRGGEDRILSSRISDNADDEDHMVTYQILSVPREGDGGDPRLRWLIFWEDILRGEPFEDFDFNDLVVEITAIPEPSSALVATGALALLSLRRRK